VFENCYELRQAFELLLRRPDKLSLVTGELWPAERALAEGLEKEVPGEAVMESVEHIGQYVFEMTSTRVKQMSGGEVVVATTGGGVVGEEGEGEGEGGGEEEEQEEEGKVRVEGFEAEEE
jgi:intron-binding protein aquarius